MIYIHCLSTKVHSATQLKPKSLFSFTKSSSEHSSRTERTGRDDQYEMKWGNMSNRVDSLRYSP